MDRQRFLRVTTLLDYQNPEIQSLVGQRGWATLDEEARIGAIYRFVRDEIRFGYDRGDRIPASEVLRDGYGQCNSKAVLLMALLRAVGIATRWHGFKIDRELQKGALPFPFYQLSPRQLVHSWVEVHYDNRWIALEGVIIDREFLTVIQERNPGQQRFCGYGIATESLTCPPIEWRGEDTFIQKEGISNDLGLFDDPDTFYCKHPDNLSGIKKWLFAHCFRHWINRHVAKVEL